MATFTHLGRIAHFNNMYVIRYVLYVHIRHVPSHASKEVLIVMGSLTSCDPGNIFTTIEVSSYGFVHE